MRHKLNKLQRDLFKLSNEIAIHCDADFQPLTPSKIVKQFVKILAGENEYVPSHAVKDSHESIPIQITDILCGALKELIISKSGLMIPWEFDNKLKSKSTKKNAKCYFWNNPEYSILK